MKQKGRFSMALIAVLGLTLGLKLASGAYLVTTDDARLASDIERWFVGQGFATNTTAHDHFGDYVLAQKDDCKILIGNAHIVGHTQSRTDLRAQEIGPITYHYGNKSSQEFPRFWPVLYSYAQRYLYRLGIELSLTPILAIAKSPACNVSHQPDTTKLRIWPIAIRQSSEEAVLQ